jgi:hypothetical protein
MAVISEEMRPEETMTGRDRKCYQDLQNQKLDLEERSTTSKTVEEPNHIVGVGEARDVGAPATLDSFAPTVGMETYRKRFMFGHLD